MSKASIVSKVFILFSSLVLSSFAQLECVWVQGMFDDTVWFLDVTPKTSLVSRVKKVILAKIGMGADAGKFYFCLRV